MFQLIGDCDQHTLRRAWTTIQERNPILRTRIVQIGQTYLQVVIEETIQWFEGSDLQEYKRKIRSKPFSLGSPLFHYAIISEENCNTLSGQTHHSGFDGWTRNLIITDLAHILANNGEHSTLLNRPPYKSYVDWQLSLDPSDALPAGANTSKASTRSTWRTCIPFRRPISLSQHPT